MRLELGKALLRRDLYDEAAAELQKAVPDPRHASEARGHLARCFQEKGFLDLAKNEYERALEGVPEAGERAGRSCTISARLPRPREIRPRRAPTTPGSSRPTSATGTWPRRWNACGAFDRAHAEHEASQETLGPGRASSPGEQGEDERHAYRHEEGAAGRLRRAAQAALPTAVKRIDKAAKHNIIHPNNAARKKQRLSRHIAGL